MSNHGFRQDHPDRFVKADRSSDKQPWNLGNLTQHLVMSMDVMTPAMSTF